MAFLHQLRLLLWKNGLGIIRQPGWSLTLVVWPLVIFIILAITRYQFPPVKKDTCYAGPRNLPSAGFFPFLQTFLCNTDSTCHNKSRLLTPHASTSTHGRWAADHVKSVHPPVMGLLHEGGAIRSALAQESSGERAGLFEIWDQILGSVHQGKFNNISLMEGIDGAALEDQAALNAMLESMNLLKRSVCSLALPMVDPSSINPFTYAVVTFCKSNNTFLEVSLLTLNQMLTELMLNNPSQAVALAGEVVLVYGQLQNESGLWESFVAVPRLLSPTSLDQALRDTEVLLTNIQGAMNIMHEAFPGAGISVSMVHPLLAGGINLIHYIQKWPGRDVYITLGDVVTLQNDTISEAIRHVLQGVRIPLDKAIGLTLDQDTLHSHLCNNSSNPMWLTAACATGTVNTLLGWISPEKVAKQVFLLWSKDVAAGDVAFAKGMLHSLMGGSGSGGQGGQNNTRSRRSVDPQPQNIEEELFLEVGKVLLDIIKSVPTVDMVVQRILRSGFTSMQTANLAIDTMEAKIDDVLQDAEQLQQTFLTLMTNQSEASAWLGLVLDSIEKMVMEVLTSTDPLTCEDLLSPFEWLLSSNSVETAVWRAMICQNSSALQHNLLLDWLPLVQKVQEIYSTVLGQAGDNVTLPMILSEWHTLMNNTLNIEGILNRISKEVGVDYWMNWMPENNTYDMTGILQQRLFLAMVSYGEKLEKSHLWPQVKTYLHMANWIINYKPGITAKPANCSIDENTLAVHCDTGLNWPQFIQATTHTLMSLPDNPEILLSCLKGTVTLLQHVYGDILKHQSGLYFQQEILSGDALSAYLINLMSNLNGFAQMVSTLNDSAISNSDLMLPHVFNLLQSTGLTPLMPLFYSNGPLNISRVIDVALKLGRLNQHIFTFNETDPTMPELERLIFHFLSMEGNLTLPLSLSMGHTLLVYTSYLHPQEVARLRNAIQPYTNQTSAGITEAILSTMELFKSVMDAPSGDPTGVILGYLRQLQEFLVSALRLRRTDYLQLPSGQLSTAQVTDLYLTATDLLNLISPEGLQNLTQAGPEAAQKAVLEKMLALLPLEVRLRAVQLLQDFQELQTQLSVCNLAGQDCVAGVSEIVEFLNQILEIMQAGKGNITIQLTPTNPFLRSQESLHIALPLFSLLLSPMDAAYVRAVNQTLYFIRLVMATPNITVSDVQNALTQSNLTLVELDSIATMAGAANISDLMVNIMMIINIHQCFKSQQTPVMTSQCAMGLIHGMSGFLAHLPTLRNETAILSFIPALVNKAIADIVHVNGSSDPHLSTIQILNSTLANIKNSLQLIHLNTSEIMNEIRVVEGLLKLAISTQPFNNINSTLMGDPQYAQKVYLEIAQWYLKKLENVTSTSSFSDLLFTFYRVTEMQLALQLAQADFTLFVNDQVENLVKNLQYPLDGRGLSKIGQTIIEILREQMEQIKVNLEIQNEYFQKLGGEPVVNITILNGFEQQIKEYLDLIQDWMRKPNVSMVLTSMLQWNNNSTNISTPGMDLHQLLQTMVHFLSDEQLAYLSLINNITQSLNKALVIAEQPGGLQSDHFSAAILETVQSTMQSLTSVTGPLPLSAQKNIMSIVWDSLQLILHPEMSFASSRNISLLILKRAESVVQQTLPKMVADYLQYGIQIMTTYFETMSSAGGPDKWNEIILNEMKTVQSLLPSNSTVQAHISVIINITHFVLEHGQGIVTHWESFLNASAGNLAVLSSQIGKLLNSLLPLVMGESAMPVTIPPLESFADFAPVLQQILTGQANEHTWHKLEMLVEAVLSTLNETELWEDIPLAASLMDKVIGAVVDTMQAENALILSFQRPLVTLMAEIAHSVNTSRFNLSDVAERMQLAIQLTMQAAKQANGSLECSEALNAWEPVREAAGLSRATLAVWCNISLQPVLEAHASAQALYASLNTTHMGLAPATVNATAERIVEALHSLYQVNVNRSIVTEGLITVLSSQLSKLAEKPLVSQAQIYWYQHFQDMQLKQGLASVKMISHQLLGVAPSLHAYIESMDSVLSHILNNYQFIEDSNQTEAFFKEAGAIFLTSMNISSDFLNPMMWENLSGLNMTHVSDIMQEAVKLMVHMKVFGDMPMVYQAMEQFLASNETRLIVERVTEMFSWWSSTNATGMDLLTHTLPKVYETFKAFLSILRQMNLDLPANLEVFEMLAGNVTEMLMQMESISDLLSSVVYHVSQPQGEMKGSAGAYSGAQQTSPSARVRHRRDAPGEPAREPMDYFIDLFYIDYPALFKAISVPPTMPEIIETAHVFFANPDLSVVMKGVTREMPWGLNSSKDETIDTALGVLSYLTVPTQFNMSSLDQLRNVVDLLPEGVPFFTLLKNITRGHTRESLESLILIQQTIQTGSELLNSSMAGKHLIGILGRLTSQVCAIEKMDSVQQLMQELHVGPGQVCQVLMPSLQILAQILMGNRSELSNALFQTFVGDPSTYAGNANWTSLFSASVGFNTSSLNSLNINLTSPGTVKVGELLRNKTAFMLDVQRHMDVDPHFLHLLMETTLPDNNVVILSWLVSLQHCNNSTSFSDNQTASVIFQAFCSFSAEHWYTFSLLVARHLNMERLIYRMVLSEDMQSVLGVMLQMAKSLTDIMSRLVPAISQLQTYLYSIENLNLVANHEFKHMVRGQRSSMSSHATFTTLSRAMCSNGILSLFGISKLPTSSESEPSSHTRQQREEMIRKFKIPRDASPFCMNLYLDMVNTTGGAIAWAFLKPMLMGQILYTPDNPITRAIMEKANSTLQEFANLKMYSEDWIQSSSYIMQSAKILSDTLPMLQNSLSNSFVKNFIEMQTDINVGSMKETLSHFSNMTVMLQKNKHILRQITALSTLMLNISTCVEFDRYRGYNSADEMNAVAQELVKHRDLYASVIFTFPDDEGSSKKRDKRTSSSSSSSSPLPPKVSYTIRMHMENVMRTDRVRDPYFVKDTHISARQTLRYNRGFVYLQESLDRAVIEIQTGQKVTEPAVQLQPFPYPCHFRDEYLEAVSFVFPLMLMIAWVLFVADFVKKLVHERELRLHEYMKMMGVNPLSHFFAWFLECSSYLVFTVIILTLVLKYGNILPNSDGFLLFLYFCDYSLSILAISYLVSAFFDKTYIAGLSGSLIYVLSFFPYIVVMALESKLSLPQKSALGLFAPTCFSYASQYISRYESQGEGIHWNNSYISPMAGDTASFGWLCWLMLIDSILYFIIGAYIRMVFPGKYGIPAPWYFPFKTSYWLELCSCCSRGASKVGRGLLFANIMRNNQPVLPDDKGKGPNTLSPQADEEISGLPVGVTLHGLTKIYGDRVAIQNLNVSFCEGHVTSLLGHNGAGKTTTMSLLTGLFAPCSGSIEVYGRDMQANIDNIRKELGVCMQYDVHFDHMTVKEHLLLYGQIKAPHWSQRELHEQVTKILEETGMYAHRHKRVGTLSGGMKRKLSISIAFIGGSRLVVLDEPTTGVDPCSRRNIWDIIIKHKRDRTIIMSTHHLDEAEVLSDRIAFLERGGLKCCGSPFYLKDRLGQGYKLTLTKKIQSPDSEDRFDSAALKAFIQAHVPEARLKEAQVGDLIYSLPPFTSSNASAYRSLLTALDANLDALQLGCYGISDTTLEEVFLQLTHDNPHSVHEDSPPSIPESASDSGSIDSFPEDLGGGTSSSDDKIKLTGSSTVHGLALAWQQVTAMLVKRFHHSRRDWKGLISQVLLPVLFVVIAMGLGSIKNDMQHYPKMELSPALYKIGPSYSFFSNQNPGARQLEEAMMSFPGIDNLCLDKPDHLGCRRSTQSDTWKSSGNASQQFSTCKCTPKEQVCRGNNYLPPHKKSPSSQTVFNLTGINVENYLVATANDFIRNRYGGFDFGKPLPPDLQMDLKEVPKNRTLTKIWYNPEGHHTMPAYLNSLNNLILRSSIPSDKEPQKYAISASSHPYFGHADDEDSVVQGVIQILVALSVLTGYAIMTASFAIYEVHEYHSGSKRLQHIAGISEPLYWAVNFLYDMLLYLIPVALTVGVIAAFQNPAFMDRQNLAAVTLLLVLFGFATFPWMYLLSSVFKDAEMAFITYVCVNLFISVNTIMSTSIFYFLGQLEMHNNEAVDEIFRKLSQAFLIFPQFSFGNGLMELARGNMEVQILSGYGIDAYKNPFCMNALGWMFISLFIQGLVFFTLRLLLNKWLIRKVRGLIFGRKVAPRVSSEDGDEDEDEDEDEDVAAEHLRVSSGAASSDILQVNQLTKVYQHLNKKVQAVKRLSVGIPAGECFGLLGVNGAGKTTTFKMLTGDVYPTDGTAQIKDWDGRMVDIMECRSKGINIGYCPQVDALDDLLSGDEHLYFYARIRGISKKEIDGVVNYLVRKLELGYHRNRVTDGYSCGTRRKLSTALALIGHPQILLLDEPSSGMDPRTKRHLWKIISEEVRGKCAVVLTSHSMEECEALCTRLAIMVKGQFRCLGPLQHIKNRFGSGFTVKMYLSHASCDVESITGFMQRHFPSTYLKDQHSAMVEYHIPVAPGGVAHIFDQLESNKITLQIKHFSVSQTTLDEVFINFAMGKIGMETIPLHSDHLDSLCSIEAVQR